MSDISFEEQIRLEEEEKKRKEEEAQTVKKDADELGRVFSADGLSYTDKDGCHFEWVADKNAWFPKIDEDFIARYQMSYGVDEEKQKEEKQRASEVAAEEEKKKEEQNAEAYKQWYSQYQQWYNSQRTSAKKDADAASSHSAGEGSESGTAGVTDGDALPPMPEDPNSEEYREWYAKWMEKNAQVASKGKKRKKAKEEKEEKGETEEKDEEEEEEEDDDDDDDEDEEYTYEDYMRYWNYYYAPIDQENKDDAKPEVGKKRKAPTGAAAAAAAKEPPAWFDVDDVTKNTNVYVSDLPSEITMEEFKEFMSKVGIIMVDETTKQPKIKLYTDEEGRNKGDGRCCYLKYESVILAEQILDGYELKGKKVKVEQAKFSLKGEFNPALRKKKKNNKKKKKNAQEKMLEWQLEKGRGQRAKREKTTVLKNVFEAEEFDKDPTRINVLRDAIKTECAQFGDVKKVVVHDRNPEGVVCVIFAEAEHSDGCIAAMHERLRAGRKITAECWDGKTKYDVKETDEERQKRIDKWQKYLAGEEDDEDDKKEKEDEKKVKDSSSMTPSAEDKSLEKDDKDNDEEEEEDDGDEDAREDERQNDFLENDDED